MMNQERQQPNHTEWKHIVVFLVSSICFAVGGWHTAKGLERYDFFASTYGSFLIAGVIVILLFTFYVYAVNGSFCSLLIYIVFATVTFVCNVNWFYPHDRGDALIRKELRTHDAAFAELKETIQKNIEDPAVDSLGVELEGMKDQLKVQILQGGFGQRAEEVLQNIERKLTINVGTITRLKLGKNNSEWKETSQEYENIIKKYFDAYFLRSKYNDKKNFIEQVKTQQSIFSNKIKASLSDSSRLYLPPPYVEDIVKSHHEICQKAEALSGKKSMTEVCGKEYSSTNKEIGTFSHTFISIRENIADGSTKMVLFFVFLIDYFIPLSLFFLARPVNTPPKTGWKVGGQDMPTAAR